MIGFINFVVKPSFEILVNIVPECNAYLTNIKQNLNFYENAVNKKDEKNDNNDVDLDSASESSESVPSSKQENNDNEEDEDDEQ